MTEKTIQNKTQTNAKELSSDMSSDWENIKEQALKTTDALYKAANHLKEHMGEAFHDGVDTLKEKSSDFQDSFSKYVKTNPVKSIGWAALAGIVLSHLIRK